MQATQVSQLISVKEANLEQDAELHVQQQSITAVR